MDDINSKKYSLYTIEQPKGWYYQTWEEEIDSLLGRDYNCCTDGLKELIKQIIAYEGSKICLC